MSAQFAEASALAGGVIAAATLNTLCAQGHTECRTVLKKCLVALGPAVAHSEAKDAMQIIAGLMQGPYSPPS